MVCGAGEETGFTFFACWRWLGRREPAIFSGSRGCAPAAVRRAERLVRFCGRTERAHSLASYLNFVDWRDQNRVFDHMAAYSGASAAFTYGDVPEQLEGAGVTADLFKVLGTQPLLGRALLREDERPNARVVVLSHSLWQRRFNADPKIVGQQVKFDGESTTVIGVMPKGFAFPLEDDNPEFWVPLDPEHVFNKERGANYLKVVARLKAGTTLEQAGSEMETIGRRLEQEYPDKNTGKGIRLVSMHEDVVGAVRPGSCALERVGFCALALANFANLRCSRLGAPERDRDRTALGESGLCRQLSRRAVRNRGRAAGLLLGCGDRRGLSARFRGHPAC